MLQVFTANKNKKYIYFYNIPKVVAGEYHQYYEDSECLLISDSPTELVNAFSISIPTQTISPKDKIYFTKTSGYPSLLFSKLKEGGYNLNISRTINPDKADKIIFKSNPIAACNGYKGTNCYLTTLNENGQHRICMNIANLTDVQILAQQKTQLEQKFNRKFYYAKYISDGETAEIYLAHKSKATYVMDLIKYTNTFLPPMSDLELDMAITYLKSSDEQARKLGIEMFQYNNLSGQLYNVLKELLTKVPTYYIPNYSEGSVAWKYLYTILQISDHDIHYRSFNQNQNYFLKKIMKNPLSTQNMDELIELIKQQLLYRLKNDREFKELREDLELINCELIIHDKNGEATTGD